MTEDTLRDSPWPEELWSMTEADYVMEVPDEKLRSAISGFLMRQGWQLCKKHLGKMLEE